MQAPRQINRECARARPDMPIWCGSEALAARPAVARRRGNLTMIEKYSFGPALRARLSANLGAFERTSVDNAELRQAGVVIVVVRNLLDDSASVLLTKRPENLRRHAGQFALPGGRLELGETSTQAAIRELAEEMRLHIGAADILGTLDDFPTRSGFRITPVVAWGGDVGEIDPDPVEVAKVFRIPLTELDNPAIPRLTGSQQDDKPPVMSAPLPTTGGVVYAPTAALLYQFREVAMHGRPTRVAHFDQPRFAWK